MSTNAIVRLQPGEDATRALKTLDRFLARSGAYQAVARSGRIDRLLTDARRRWPLRTKHHAEK